MNESTMYRLLNEGYELKGSALARGYVRVGEEVIKEYKGRYGEGYTVYVHNDRSSRYCIKYYFVK